jgi:hypothetical protein
MKYLVVLQNKIFSTVSYSTTTVLTNPNLSSNFTTDTIKEFNTIEEVEKFISEFRANVEIRVFEIAKELKFSHKFNWE